MPRFSAEKNYALFDTPANKKLAADISASGAKSFLFPAVETAEIDDAENKDFSNIQNDFDWLIFPDIYTVEFFLRKMENADFDLYELDALRVCAYGESVADRLRFAQLHADVVPNSIKTKDVWNALESYLSGENEFADLRFLIFKPQDSRVDIADCLRKQNSNIFELEIYRIAGEETAEIARLKTLLRGGAIDEFVFTSPFDALNLAHLFPNENLKDVLEEVRLTPTDDRARQSLGEFRLL